MRVIHKFFLDELLEYLYDVFNLDWDVLVVVDDLVDEKHGKLLQFTTVDLHLLVY